MIDKVASTVVEGFRQQPAMLLILVLNLAFLALVYFGVESSNQRRHIETTNLIDRCFSQERN